MSMRLYKVSGQWYTWDYLHNELGYTESASTTTAYKSSDSDTWGQSVVDSGYRIATDSSDLETYEFWIDNVSGWFGASEMAQEGYYPSFATDGPRFVKEGELSVSVEISGNSWSGVWYLLKKDVTIGWCTERELEENGWEPDRGEIVGGLISGTYDKRIYSFGNGGLLVPGGYAYSDGDLLDMTWDFGGTVEEYSPVVPLPTVSIVNDFNAYNWLTTQSQTAETVNAGDSVQLYLIGIGIVTYDQNKSYAILQWQVTQQVTAGRTEFSIINDSGYLSAKNVSGSSLSFLQARVAVCSSNQTEVVTVYKLSDGVLYNAFKYTLDGTDYYYVLDGTQTDWTDYPESIGYSRYPFESLNEIAFDSVTLPETHLGAYVGTVFDSLRYYAKGTLSNTGSISGTYFGRSINYFYGTLTWTDRSLGDLTDKIAITNLTDQSISSQSLFRIIFIYSGITGYHPSDTETNDNFISNYTYRDGEHSITFYCTVNAWIDTQYPDIGRIQIRYLDGTTMFNGLSGFDLFDAPSFNILSKSTTTDRYGMYSSWNGSVKVYALYSNFIYVPVFRAYLSTSGAAVSGDITLSHGNHLLYDKTGTLITFESKYYRLLKLTKYYGDDTTKSGLSLSNDGGNLVIYNDNYSYYPDAYVIEYLCIPSQLTNQTIKAYKSDGTVSNCELDNNGHYRIASFDNNAWHTEPELNTGGWYIRWRIYSTTNRGGINIRDNGSVIGTNTIGKYYTSQHPIGNPFLIQVDPNDSTYTMQKLLFTEDNGSTVQTGWTVCAGNSSVSFTLGFVDSDVAFLSNF